MNELNFYKSDLMTSYLVKIWPVPNLIKIRQRRRMCARLRFSPSTKLGPLACNVFCWLFSDVLDFNDIFVEHINQSIFAEMLWNHADVICRITKQYHSPEAANRTLYTHRYAFFVFVLFCCFFKRADVELFTFCRHFYDSSNGK